MNSVHRSVTEELRTSVTADSRALSTLKDNAWTKSYEMKNNLFLLSFGLGIVNLTTSCSEQKSVTEQLDVNETSTLIKQDTLYEQIIQRIESVREVFEKDLEVKTKFKDLSYKDFLEYNKEILGTTFQTKLSEKLEVVINSRLDNLIKKHKVQVDQKMLLYKELRKKHTPSEFFSVSFAGISKEYNSSQRGLQYFKVKFEITPLQGPIEGGSFRYRITSKQSKKTITSVDCRFTQYIQSPCIYMWEASNEIEQELEGLTTESIKENYDFEYDIMTVDIKGETCNSNLIDIPFYSELYLEKDTLTRDEYANLIEELFSIKPISHHTLLTEVTDSEKQNINKLAFELEKLIDEF